MKCPNCGKQIPNNARFCGYCSYKIQPNDKPSFLKYGIVVAAIIAVIGVLLFLIVSKSNLPKKKTEAKHAETVQTDPLPTVTDVVHTHVWKSATCTVPQTCSSCGDTTGSPTGHQWEVATCTAPKSCSSCGATVGAASGHQWKDATYEEPKTCTVCGKTTGSALNPLAKLSVGNKFEFGVYEQDGSSSNGSEDIEWVVLDKTSDKILVISKYALDCQRYHRQNESVTWETCSVRTWLNSTFYNAAFSADEKEHILITQDTETAVKDKVFLLSIDELEEYYSGKTERICRATSYAIDQNAYVNPSTGGSWWLLRTKGESSKHVMSVNSDGKIDYDGGKVASDRGTVRPAMWLDISN